MTALFVTSTGTGIGKTFVTAALAHAARQAGRSVRVAKPIVSGFTADTVGDSDTAVLLESAGLPVNPETVAACSPWRFGAPLSPDMAAAREGQILDFDAIAAWCARVAGGPEDLILIEGVGGAMVPLDETRTVRDLIGALNLPLVLVTGSYLGTISHTLTTLEALRGSVVASIVISESTDSPVPVAETAAAIGRFTGAPIAVMPRLGHWRAADPGVAGDVLAQAGCVQERADPSVSCSAFRTSSART